MTLLDHDHEIADDWPFDDSPNVGVIISRTVVDDQAPLIGIIHDKDGDWQFLDGGSIEVENAALACLKCVYDKHPEIGAFANLPKGHEAWRDDDRGWVRSRPNFIARAARRLRDF